MSDLGRWKELLRACDGEHLAKDSQGGCFAAHGERGCPRCDAYDDLAGDTGKMIGDLTKAIDLLVRCWKAGHREGWHNGETNNEVFDAVNSFLTNVVGSDWGPRLVDIPEDRARSTKTETLTALPLWECWDCGRLEFATVQPDCPQCYLDELAPRAMRPVACPDSVEKFEAIGQHFHRDTGYVRPGKDCLLHDPEDRERVFKRWNATS